MKVIGYEKNSFKTKDGAEVSGFNIYLSSPIAADIGKGVSAERIYLTDAKLAASNTDVERLMNHQVDIFYNRFGKIQRIAISE